MSSQTLQLTNHIKLLFLIDLDNTLFFTDQANNFAYEKAIKITINNNSVADRLFNKICSLSTNRVTKDIFYHQSIIEEYSTLLQRDLNKNEIDTLINDFVSNKNKVYEEFLPSIEENFHYIFELVDDIQNKFITENRNISSIETIKIIVTNANSTRAKKILENYNLTKYFREVIFCNNLENKYEFALNRVKDILGEGILMENIFIFDDEPNQLINIKTTFPCLPQNNLILISRNQINTN